MLEGIKSKHKENVDVKNIEREFFSKLSKELIRKLYAVYKIDFELLQYDYPQAYIDMGYGI